MKKNKTALITGITGQDGSFLTRLLLEKGYEFYGLKREGSGSDNFTNFNILGIDSNSIKMLHLKEIEAIKDEIDEVYNLGAQSSVAVSWVDPVGTYESNVVQFVNLLEVFKNTKVKILQASSAEIFEPGSNGIINEDSEISPRNPYAVSKYAAHKHVQLLRESANLFVSNAILFNHESELRPEKFVTRKITKHVAMYSKGKKQILEVGNIMAERDWGYAGEFVEGMWSILQHNKADDFIIATGQKTSVKQFIEFAFNTIDIKILWEGEDIETKGYHSETKELLVQVNSEFFRPLDQNVIVGDCSKSINELGWNAKILARDIAKMMVQFDIKLLKF